jgi:outer membrane protein assembly factor BamB
MVYAAGREGRISALSATNGALLWTYNTGGTLTKPLLTADGLVYAETETDTGNPAYARLFAIKATRSMSWSKNLTAHFGTGPDWQTLTLDNGLLYAVNGKNSVSAFHAHDGTTATSYSLDGPDSIVEFELVS